MEQQKKEKLSKGFLENKHLCSANSSNEEIVEYFISQLDTILAEKIEKIEKKITKQDESDFESDYDDQMEAYQQKGYNEAVEDVITILKE